MPELCSSNLFGVQYNQNILSQYSANRCQKPKPQESANYVTSSGIGFFCATFSRVSASILTVFIKKVLS